jgi:four helix bundle protein
MKTHKDLNVWIKGIELVKVIYSLTAQFPQSEQFGLVSQMRRSAVSVPSNIAEGCGRHSDKELIHFLYIMLGSASELETQLIISVELGFISKTDSLFPQELINEIMKMASALINSIKARNNG